MDPAASLATVEPQPVASPSRSPHPRPPGPETQTDERRPATRTLTPTPTAAGGPVDLRNVKASCQFGLGEYLGLWDRRRRVGGGAELDSRIDAQANVVLGHLRALQTEVRGLERAAEKRRWRRWLLGGVIAAFVPAVRRILRRGSDDESRTSANDTEYAFGKSKGLMTRIRHGVLGGGTLAKVALFVFAVLFVFQNEVSLRVARTVRRRIERLCERVQAGGADVGDQDVAVVLEGWRWRILLW